MEPPPTPGEARPAGRLVPLACLALLLITQFLVPALLLLGPRPSRGGWQMYSAAGSAPAVSIVAADGAVTPLELSDYLGWGRTEIDLAAVLPPFVCARHPEAAAVRLRFGAAEQEHLCAPLR